MGAMHNSPEAMASEHDMTRAEIVAVQCQSNYTCPSDIMLFAFQRTPTIWEMKNKNMILKISDFEATLY